MIRFLLTIALISIVTVSTSQVWVCGIAVGDEYYGETKIATKLGGLNGVIFIHQQLLDNRVAYITFYPTTYGFTASPLSSATFSKFIKKIKKKYKAVFIEDYEQPKSKDFPYDRLFYAVKYDHFVIMYAFKYLDNDKNRVVFAFQVVDNSLMPGDNYKSLWDKK